MTSPTARRRSSLATWGPWLAMAVVLVAALLVGTFGATRERTNADRLLDVSRTIRCPQCNGESVAESNAAVSQEIRLDIARRIEQGQTDDQIRQAYIDQYDDYIVLTPKSTGVTSLVWIIPVVALVVALAALALAFQRWKVRGDVHASEADRELVGRALRAEPPEPGEPDDPEMGGGR